MSYKSLSEPQGKPELKLELFHERFDMKPYRVEKVKTLYVLALASPGPIVELGTFRGMGAVALALGSNGRPVHTVDDYRPKIGWAGEHYGLADMEAFYANCKAFGVEVELHKSDIQVAAQLWKEQIGLIFWDVDEGRILDDFAAWRKHLMPRGTFAFQDPGHFGAKGLVDYYHGRGWQRGPVYAMGHIHTLVKDE